MSKGGRPATGWIKWRRDQWYVQLTLKDGTRPWIPLDPRIPEGDRAAAQACAKLTSDRARLRGMVAQTVKETIEEYARRWLDDREGRVNSIRDDRGRVRLHVLPVIGHLDARAFTRDDVERLRDDLDRKIVRGELAWKTVGSCWTLVTSMCADMVNAKKREFRVRDDNPCRDVKPPERGARKAKQYLYPSEFLAFVSCEKIPLRWRRAVTLAIYTYTRDGELRVLRWEDVDHGIIDITRAYNRRKPGEVKGTKSDAPRRFAVEPALLPLLEAMRKDKRPLVANLPSERAMARNLRRWLWKAGVRRPALHEGSPTSQNLTWHDLRATGATWMAVRGDDPHKIMQRCGHRSFTTTMLYVREGEAIREGFGEPFPALPEGIVNPSGGFATVPHFCETDDANYRESLPFRRGGRDSNANRETARSTENLAADTIGRRDNGRETQSPSLEGSRPFVRETAEPSDAELERGILASVAAGAFDVARTLSAQLGDRQRARAGTLLRLDDERRRRGR